MAFISTIPPEQATGAVRDMYERQAGTYGYVPNYARVFCHRPELMRLWADLQIGIKRHMDRRRFELITFAAAQALRNSYCSLAHGKVLTEYYSPEQVRSMTSEADCAALSAAERAMMRFARRVARDASAVTAGDVAALREHGFDDGEIFDIAAAAAARAFVTKLVDSMGTRPDAALGDIDPKLRESLVVGRQIAGAGDGA